MCLDVPEISLSTFSSQGLMLSSTAGNIEEDWEGFEASVVLCAIEMQVALNVSGCTSRRKRTEKCVSRGEELSLLSTIE